MYYDLVILLDCVDNAPNISWRTSVMPYRTIKANGCAWICPSCNQIW